jgi:hypothetical protein
MARSMERESRVFLGRVDSKQREHSLEETTVATSTRVILAALVFALSSCSQPASLPPPTPAPAAGAVSTTTVAARVSNFPGAPSPIASQCSWNLPGFGKHRHGVYAPGRGTIAMSNDGWCSLHINFLFSGQPYLAPTAVDSPPSHGTVKIVSSGVSVHAYYRPASGYIGEDYFTLAYKIPNHDDSIAVYVTVSQ